MSNIAAVRKFEISPDNQSSSNQSWSPQNGNPIITFTIANSEMWLRASKLKMCFDVELFVPAVGADVPPTAGQCQLNDRIGVAGLFQQLEINNLTLNQNLETIRNFGRLQSSLISNSSGWDDYTTYLSNEFCSSANVAVNNRYCGAKMSCAMPIMAGLFMGNNGNIPLSNDNGVGGIFMKFSLQPSLQALFGTSVAAGAYYKISNVSLMGEYAMPRGGKLPNLDSYEFSAFSSFYSVINNNDVMTQLNPALSAIVTSFSNFVPTTWISAGTEDGYKTTPLLNTTIATGVYDQLAPITRLSFLRSGILYPLQAGIDESRMVTTDGGVGNVYGNSKFQSLRQYYYSMSIRPKTSPQEDTIAGQNSEGLPFANNDIQHNTVSTTQAFPESGTFSNAYGVGIRVGDMLGMGNSVNFKSAPFGIRLQSKLNGYSPMSMYTFFMYRSRINYGQNGIVQIIN
tara:strand:- start:18761 stop:20125 length:1365 start_codon:yes stop_codon:yes gene_type:complete